MSCSNDNQIDIDSILIVKVNQHPTLIDHERKLMTINKNGLTIDELLLYPDSGDGCNSFVFDNGKSYILIDCNGQWFSINKENGQLTNEGWKWQEALPPIQLGVFTLGGNSTKYKFMIGDSSTLLDVYNYKDPQE